MPNFAQMVASSWGYWGVEEDQEGDERRASLKLVKASLAKLAFIGGKFEVGSRRG